MSRSLLETFAPSLSTLDGMKRVVHRIGEPEEIEEENTMPRKPSASGPNITLEEAAAKAAARKPKRRKYTRHAVPPMRTLGAEPTFIVDDAGRVAILHDKLRIDLSAGATKRLVVFLDKHAK